MSHSKASAILSLHWFLMGELGSRAHRIIDRFEQHFGTLNTTFTVVDTNEVVLHLADHNPEPTVHYHLAINPDFVEFSMSGVDRTAQLTDVNVDELYQLLTSRPRPVQVLRYIQEGGKLDESED